ncbi:iron-sulfur cluster assembly accessory protein [soil metagenome]
MIELTAVAAGRLTALRSEDPAKSFLRVYVAGKSCCGYQYGLAFDEAAGAEDRVAQVGGIPVVIDPRSLPYVEGATIDFVDALACGGFTVRNERLDSGGCACGRGSAEARR